MSYQQLAGRIMTGDQKDGVGNYFRMFIVDEAAREQELSGRDIIRLTLGISDLPLHPAIIEAIVGATQDSVRSNRVFPEGLPELREALAAHYTQSLGTPVSVGRILVDAGTSSIYPKLVRLLANPGDEVLIPLPYYPLYCISAILAGVQTRYYRVDLRTLRIDMGSFEENLTAKTRIVVVNSPGNPLGNIITPPELRHMCDILPKRTHIMFDEIYENVAFTNEPKLAPILLSPDHGQASRVILTNSCSKGYRMYTKRVGWCVLPEGLVPAMSVMLQHTRLTGDPAVQYGAVAALGLPGEVEALREVHRQRWKCASIHLGSLGGVRLIPSRGGFYCTLDCRERIEQQSVGDGMQLAMDILSRVGVAVVPGEDFGLPGTLRLSFTARRFEEATRRLSAYFRERL